MKAYLEIEMPKSCAKCKLFGEYGCPFIGAVGNALTRGERNEDCPLVPIPEYGRLRKRIVYRGEVFNAIEAARINALDGILTDRYKDGFHDGLKRALEILANEVQDVPTIIPASEDGE